MKISCRRISLALALMPLGFVGCNTGNATVETSSASSTKDAHVEHAELSHPTEGPHHGGLIELGNEEYHAEIVHDEETGSVTIYLFNSAATEPVPVESPEIAINLKYDGKPQQFKLVASPDADDPQGKSSRFISTDAEVGKHLDEDGAEPKLVVKIAGKSFRGTIAHDHESHERESHDD